MVCKGGEEVEEGKSRREVEGDKGGGEVEEGKG